MLWSHVRSICINVFKRRTVIEIPLYGDLPHSKISKISINAKYIIIEMV